MSSAIFYDRPEEMEPMLPSDLKVLLREKASLLWRDSGALTAILPEPSRAAVAEVVRSMNGYYSNLIEGHKTRPLDIEAALTRNFSSAPQDRQRQLLHYAHLETLRKAEESLTPDTKITSPEYLCWLHAEFFRHLPPEFRIFPAEDGREHDVEPGVLRTHNVSVGQHLAPAHESLPAMLDRFHQAYQPEIRDIPDSLVAAAAAHHRFTWIHPFGDGNGRIARMLTHLWFIQAGAGAAGLWTLSRGLARRVEHYKTLLAGADEKRMSDFDGRGRMSDRKLSEFCDYLLETARDQVKYMAETLQMETLASRLAASVLYKENAGELPKRSAKLVREALIKGQLARTEASAIMGVSARTAQPIVQTLVKRGYLKSPSERGKLSVGFPTEICAFAFPELFPTGQL